MPNMCLQAAVGGTRSQRAETGSHSPTAPETRRWPDEGSGVDPATTDPEFVAKLVRWFDTNPEVLVLFRFRRAAGSRSYEFYSSPAALSERIRGLPEGTAVSLFSGPQLPIRGIVDDAFVTRCLDAIPEGAEYLVVETMASIAGTMSWFSNGSGESHVELRDDLESSRGKPVAVGVHPPWPGDLEDPLSAVVPDGDGVVRRGPY